MKIRFGSFTSNSKEFYGTLIITCDCRNVFSCWYEKNHITGNETEIYCPYCRKKIETQIGE
jgi:hypothetical protein